MRSAKKRIVIVMFSAAVIMASGVGIFMLRDHRSVLGHIVRSIKGEPGGEQKINDLADDIRTTPSLAQIQPWGMETLRRFRNGELQTNSSPNYWWDDRPAIKLAHQERPDFIKHQWGETNEYGEEEPELYVVLGTNRQPEVVVIAWYEDGIEIGSPEHQMPYKSAPPFWYVEVKPGMYVYNNYK